MVCHTIIIPSIETYKGMKVVAFIYRLRTAKGVAIYDRSKIESITSS